MAPSRASPTGICGPGACSTIPSRAPVRGTLGTSSRSSWRTSQRRRGPSVPRRDDISSVLIIGSGPIVIGQAAEFDYSGTQACHALREEGYRVILVNSNPATIMTDPEVADATYVEPLTAGTIEEIIRRERPDALLPTLGGQTALNLAIELHEASVLYDYGVELHGPRPRRGRGPRPRDRLPPHNSPQLYPGRQRRRHSPRPPRAQARRPRRLRREPRTLRPRREERRRLEGVRARGHARPRRQRGSHLLHRERGPHGRPHRRLHNRRPGPDPLRQAIPVPPLRFSPHNTRDRGLDGGIQHPVRGGPGERRDLRDRDEPAGEPLERAREQGHRVSDRQDSGETGGPDHRRLDPRQHKQGEPTLLR